MKHRSTFTALALTLAFSLLSHAAPADEEGFISIFNGNDLTGWEGREGAWWVEDGCITSESTPEKPCKSAHYLFWMEQQPADFILRFKYKLIGGNSGVQIRSKKLDKHDAWGYQADIEAGDQWTGCLFQHDRAAVVKRGYKAIIREDGSRKDIQFADPANLIKVVKKEDWNEYEVEAIGNKVILRINGKLMCEVDDNDKLACKKGYIAVQMHPGPPMKIQFKDLRIKVF